MPTGYTVRRPKNRRTAALLAGRPPSHALTRSGKRSARGPTPRRLHVHPFHAHARGAGVRARRGIRPGADAAVGAARRGPRVARGRPGPDVRAVADGATPAARAPAAPRMPAQPRRHLDRRPRVRRARAAAPTDLTCAMISASRLT